MASAPTALTGGDSHPKRTAVSSLDSDNLTFFDRTVPDARIKEAIDELGLAQWFASLGAGLDAQLQVGSGGLSAGEAQLLAFTRIFLRDPG